MTLSEGSEGSEGPALLWAMTRNWYSWSGSTSMILILRRSPGPLPHSVQPRPDWGGGG